MDAQINFKMFSIFCYNFSLISLHCIQCSEKLGHLLVIICFCHYFLAWMACWWVYRVSCHVCPQKYIESWFSFHKGSTESSIAHSAVSKGESFSFFLRYESVKLNNSTLFVKKVYLKKIISLLFDTFVS